MKYSPELAKEILELYASGESVRNIQDMKGMPARSTISRWRVDYPKFGAAYELAVSDHVESLIDKARHVVETEADSKKAKTQSDFYCWLSGKLNRQKYGEKIDVNHNITIDIAPALASAQKRLAAMGTGQIIDVPAKQVESE